MHVPSAIQNTRYLKVSSNIIKYLSHFISNFIMRGLVLIFVVKKASLCINLKVQRKTSYDARYFGNGIRWVTVSMKNIILTTKYRYWWTDESNRSEHKKTSYLISISWSDLLHILKWVYVIKSINFIHQLGSNWVLFRSPLFLMLNMILD